MVVTSVGEGVRREFVVGAREGVMDDGAVRGALAGQLEAALSMLEECVRACPDTQWDERIAKYPFWMVAYHTLCFVDCYLARSNESFTRIVEDRVARRERGEPVADFHPKGMQELEEEYPSRRFSRDELLAYLEHCRGVCRRVLVKGEDEPLDGPSGFSWLAFSRLEAHVYNIRHVQHHTGQLGAFLRRAGVELRWVKSGGVQPVG
jgi:hypothetical protein